EGHTAVCQVRSVRAGLLFVRRTSLAGAVLVVVHDQGQPAATGPAPGGGQWGLPAVQQQCLDYYLDVAVDPLIFAVVGLAGRTAVQRRVKRFRRVVEHVTDDQRY